MAHDDEKMWAYITKSIVREDLKDFKSFDEFLQYHKTGNIPYGAYEKYKTLEGIEWLGTRDKYPTLISAMKGNGEVIELRADIEDAFYVRKDDAGEIVRDAKGDALYLTPEEVGERGYCPFMFTLVAFNQKGQPVGWASDEFGADGVWVAEEYQRKGIGTELLYQFRRFYPPKRKMGQMTDSGCGLVKAYYRRLEGNVEQIPSKTEVPNLKFTSGGDAVGQEYHGHIAAVDPGTGKTIGQVTYSYYNGETYIRHIEVMPEYRRQGVGTALVAELKKEGCGIGMVGNYATMEGQAFFKRVAPEVLRSDDPRS